MSINKIHCVIPWIVIYPVDSAIHLLNNRRLNFEKIEIDLLLQFTTFHSIEHARYICHLLHLWGWRRMEVRVGSWTQEVRDR